MVRWAGPRRRRGSWNFLNYNWLRKKDTSSVRIIPIFPELRSYLEQVWEDAEPGALYVVSRYRAENTNL